jgi:hypothetical protein
MLSDNRPGAATNSVSLHRALAICRFLADKSFSQSLLFADTLKTVGTEKTPSEARNTSGSPFVLAITGSNLCAGQAQIRAWPGQTKPGRKYFVMKYIEI